ncbi:hypothetical protein BU23DRAFT_602389 [Bimuria novae-zelandiae CBS 107.79]|uniref:Uncharacterized protein n=1 Tax=Bimuria novae-zelandiae CBS 107.79 TaxID=1447943 RepID=A0A6A5UTC9_9PLEO|nr:hypothetical protein BU23DRAFT_602389 [Bimuria novae-zelandiae CBS 107.79]
MGGELCGKPFLETGGLANHIKKYHQSIRLTPSNHTGNPGFDKIANAKSFYTSILAEHKKRIAATSSQVDQNPITTPPPLPARTSPAREPHNTTASSSEPDPQNTAASSSEPAPPPARADRWEIILYKRNYKSKGKKKGDINWEAMEKAIKHYGGKIPCEKCVVEGENKCQWNGDCVSLLYYKGWDDSESDDDVTMV